MFSAAVKSALPRTPWGGAPATLIRKTCLVAGVPGKHLPVYTLTFANPPGTKSLGVRIDKGDVVKVCVPGYKPKSYSMSAERAGEFDITFKVYPGGRASGYLDSISIGETIDVFRMGKKERAAGGRVGLIAYGVGITEALPIAAAELVKQDAKSVVLLWASRTVGDTFWHEQLQQLKDQYGDRFDLVTILSREQRPDALHGRCSPDVLAQVFDGRWHTHVGGANEAERQDVRFLSVGTKPMMAETDAMLAAIGYPMQQHSLLRH